MPNIFYRFISYLIPDRKKRRQFRKAHMRLSLSEINAKKLESIDHILKFSIDPHTIPPAQGCLKMIQDGSVAILNYLDGICRRHGITYWIDSGTLIGYMRHRGFIPWDDDIDIAMLRSDYDKLLSLLDTEFKKDGFYSRGGEIIQLFYKDTPCQVDVFPFDVGDSVHPPKGEQYQCFLSVLEEIKSHMDFNSAAWRARRQPVSDDYLKYCFHMRDTQLAPQPVDKGFLFYGVETAVHNRSCFAYEDIFPLRPIDFMGISTYAPNQADYYLFCQYGDYMTLPSDFSSHHGSSLAAQITPDNYKTCCELIQKYTPSHREDSCPA